MGYFSFFVSAFVSGSIFPAASEAVLLYQLVQGLDPVILILVGTIGNSLGGLSVYALGRIGDWAKIERYTRIKEVQLEAAKKRIRKIGHYAAFFSFVPFIGDPLLLVLGLAKAPLRPVLVLMTAGKGLRYWVVAYAGQDLETMTRSIFDFLTNAF